MSLPKIAQPIHTFTTTYGKEIKFRAYTFKEEKVLLLAAQDDEPTVTKILDAVKTVLDSCLIDMSVSDLKISEIEELFVRLRCVSNSNALAMTYTPPTDCKEEKCPEEIEVQALLDNYYMSTLSGKSFEEAGYKKNKDGWIVMLTDTDGLVLHEPSTLGEPSEVLWETVVSVFSQDQVYTKSDFTKEELEDFLEELPGTCLLKIKHFFDCIPTACIDVPIKCTVCGMQKTKTIKGIYNFFG